MFSYLPGANSDNTYSGAGRSRGSDPAGAGNGNSRGGNGSGGLGSYKSRVAKRALEEAMAGGWW